jgi:hypothetical protein
MRHHNHYWNDNPGHRNVKLLLRETLYEIAADLLTLNRNQTRLVKLRMGHCQLKKHLQQICPYEGDKLKTMWYEWCDIFTHHTRLWRFSTQNNSVSGDYRLENCHRQNGLVSSLFDLIMDTDLLNTQW